MEHDSVFTCNLKIHRILIKKSVHMFDVQFLIMRVPASRNSCFLYQNCRWFNWKKIMRIQNDILICFWIKIHYHFNTNVSSEIVLYTGFLRFHRSNSFLFSQFFIIIFLNFHKLFWFPILLHTFRSAVQLILKKSSISDFINFRFKFLQISCSDSVSVSEFSAYRTKTGINDLKS